MADDDKSALCLIFFFALFTTSFNVYAICAFAHTMSDYAKLYQGEEFDCKFYPKVPVLILLCFLSAITLLLLMTITLTCCHDDPSDGAGGKFVLACLYMLFGPLMTGVCVYLLLNMQTYGYTCDVISGRRAYNTKMHVLTAMFGTVGVIITVACCAKSMMKTLTAALMNNNNVFAKMVNAVLCIPGLPRRNGQNPAEAEEERLVQPQIRSQL